MTAPDSILLVEDDEDDVFLMRRALKAAGITNVLRVLEDGQEAVDYLGGTANPGGAALNLPKVIFLDLKLPVIMGLEVLAWVKGQPFLQNVAVVVLTSSNEPSDLKEAYRLGATSYVVKPPTADQLLDLAKTFRWDWLKFGKAANS